MANKQIVDYIREAEAGSLKKAEIIHNLTEAGWQDADIRDAFSYINVYVAQPLVHKALTQHSQQPIRISWISLISVVLGYLWLVSGLDKILNKDFVSTFATNVQNQLSNEAIGFYKNLFNSFVVPNAALIGYLVQYIEFGLGIILISCGIWNFIRAKKTAAFLLCLASIGSALMVLNIILSFGIPFPWVNADNAFAQGFGLEYFVLFISVVSTVAYFYEV